MDTVFAVPELLALIAEAADQKRTLYAIAQTNRTLNEVALDALWSDLDSIKPLVLLLGPVAYYSRQNPYTTRNEYGWQYQDPYLSSEGWARFTYYHHRVRRLRISPSDPVFPNQAPYPFAPSLFSSINATRPSHRSLLPNLRFVAICGRTKDAFLHSFSFLNENIRHLMLELHDSDNLTMGYALGEVTSRLPNLRTISLTSDGDGTRFEPELLSFAKALQNLNVTEITLPRHFLTTGVLTVLSQIPALKKISMDYHGSPSGIATPVSFNSLRNEGFPDLIKLAIAVPLDCALPLVFARDRATRLTEIEISSPNATNLHVEDFCRTLGEFWSSITLLQLDLFHPSFTPTAPVEFRMLLPLLQCRAMTSFFLRHRLAVRMDPDDLKMMLYHWPKLTILSISADPVQGIPSACPGLPIDILRDFAKLCPDIEHIGLFFDASQPLTWSADVPNARLEKLEWLHVGWAKPEHILHIALFLSDLCSDQMTFLIGDSLITPPVNANSPNPNRAGWEEVERLFRALSKQRERYVAREIEKKTRLQPGWTQYMGRPCLSSDLGLERDAAVLGDE